MPISYPTIEELAENMIAAYRQLMPEMDPTVFASWGEAFVRSQAICGGSLIDVQKKLQDQLFPQTATEDFLDLWGAYEGLSRLPTVSSTGLASITGAGGVGIVPVGTQFTAANGIIYENTTSGSIVSRSFSIDSITRASSTATVTVSSDHLLATGQEVVVSGAVQSEYNGTFTISVTSATTFTYQVSGAPATPATGTITYITAHITVSMLALTAGPDGNQSSGAVLTINTPINGVDDDALVQYSGLVGGTLEETDDLYRQRILLSRSLQEGVFTADQIRLAALGIAGNTRIFVSEPSVSITGLTDGFAIKGALPASPTIEYASVAAAASINISGNFSLSFWVKVYNDGLSSADRTIISKSSAASNGWNAVWDPAARNLKFGNSAGGYSNFVFPLSIEAQWVHVACVLSATTNRMYINGVERSFPAGYALTDTGTSVFMLGNSGIANSGSECELDEVRIFDALLSAADVELLYQRNVVSLSNLQAYWKFPEGTGTTSVDASGNGNTATLTSANMWEAGPGQNGPGMIPVQGQVVVYVLRDGDPIIIPSQTILDATKVAIIDNGKKPAHMYEDDIFVFGPTPIETAFTFTQLDPDTTSMRNAITAQLQSFFEDDVEFEQVITEANYLGAIAGTFDTVESVKLRTFTLSTPTTDVSVGTGEIGTLGTISFP